MSGYWLKLILCLGVVGLVQSGGYTMDRETTSYEQNSSQERMAQLNALKDQNITLHIHVLPHSHEDPGWLKTVDQYFSGQSNSIQFASVHMILDEVMRELMKPGSTKTFTYVEISFFSRWWEEQTDEMKDKVRDLVHKEKRLEFANGGWVMNDEAAAHFEDVITQMTLGHQYLLKQLDYIPTMGWHIDPFGHSSGTPFLFSQMGLDAWFFARMDYREKALRIQDQSLEFVWLPVKDAALGSYSQAYSISEQQIYTQMLYNHYSAPPGFCFDMLCSDDRIVSDKHLLTYNLDDKLDSLVDYFLKVQKAFRTEHILTPFGEDFNYQDAHEYFQNIDKLIEGLREKYGDYIDINYSSLRTFLDAVNSAEKPLALNTHDFFPYADNEDAYWSGYFTSRPTSKRLIREASSFFRAISTLLTQCLIQRFHLADQAELTDYQRHHDALYLLRKALSLAQHHDGVSGTEKQHVAVDYGMRLSDGINAVKQVAARLLKPYHDTEMEYSFCTLTNTTYIDCPTKEMLSGENNAFLVKIFNPSGPRRQVMRVKVPPPIEVDHDQGLYYSVIDHLNGQMIYSETACVPEGVNLYEANEHGAIRDCQLLFQAQFRDRETRLFLLHFHSKDQNSHSRGNHAKYIGLEEYWLYESVASSSQSLHHNLFDEEFYYTPKKVDKRVKFRLTYERYYPAQLNSGQNSGAYIFKPSPEDRKSHLYSHFHAAFKREGKLIQELWISGNRTETRLRLDDNLGTLEIETYVKPLDNSNMGTEETLNLHFINLENQNGVFYTDASGLMMQKRILNYRYNFKWDKIDDPVAGNYYPITSALAFIDETQNIRVNVATDRSQGGSVIEKGKMQLMIHRRLFRDDGRGVGEALNEVESDGEGISFWTKHVLNIEQYEEDGANEERTWLHNQRQIERLLNEPVVIGFGVIKKEENDLFEPQLPVMTELLQRQRMNLEHVKVALFPSLTKTTDSFQFSVRIQIHNILDYNSIQVSKREIIQLLDGVEDNWDIQGLDLSANNDYTKAQQSRKQWAFDDREFLQEIEEMEDAPDALVNLRPQEIRIFEAKRK